MSAEAYAIALNHSRASGSAKLVLLGVANHDGDGGSWPSVGRLAIYANVTPRNVNHSLDKLVALGEITREVNGGGGRQTADHMRPNLYEFRLKCPPNCDGTKNHRMLCIVCSKELPINRRTALTHRACAPLSVATSPVADDTRPLSVATDELNPEHTTELTNAPRLLKREEVATLSEAERCPARAFAPHSFSKGRCLDCRAADPATPIGDNA